MSKCLGGRRQSVEETDKDRQGSLSRCLNFPILCLMSKCVGGRRQSVEETDKDILMDRISKLENETIR